MDRAGGSAGRLLEPARTTQLELNMAETRRQVGVVPWVLLFCACSGSDSLPPVLPGLDHDPAEEVDCAQSPPAEGTARAKHVVCNDELASGPLAMGRTGDVLLE